jgi:hypothetical protein
MPIDETIELAQARQEERIRRFRQFVLFCFLFWVQSNVKMSFLSFAGVVLLVLSF